jgi:hypothetical protein
MFNFLYVSAAEIAIRAFIIFFYALTLYDFQLSYNSGELLTFKISLRVCANTISSNGYIPTRALKAQNNNKSISVMIINQLKTQIYRSNYTSKHTEQNYQCPT